MGRKEEDGNWHKKAEEEQNKKRMPRKEVTKWDKEDDKGKENMRQSRKPGDILDKAETIHKKEQAGCLDIQPLYETYRAIGNIGN
jgi:hypothetical protein